ASPHLARPGTYFSDLASAVKRDADDPAQITLVSALFWIAGNVDLTLRTTMAAQARCLIIFGHRDPEGESALVLGDRGVDSPLGQLADISFSRMTKLSQLSGRALRFRMNCSGAVIFNSASPSAPLAKLSVTSRPKVAGIKPLNPIPRWFSSR